MPPGVVPGRDRPSVDRMRLALAVGDEFQDQFVARPFLARPQALYAAIEMGRDLDLLQHPVEQLDLADVANIVDRGAGREPPRGK